MSEIHARLSTALAGRYRILRRLGQGGMATVFLADDLKHERKVAVKVLREELTAVLGAERFVQEIKTTASLQHPHILPLFDSGEADSLLYYVMPYIEGETLRDKLNRETQLSVEEAVRITTEIADALDYAHRHNVIHRDIKPENILLHDGRPMVADFGIALAVSAAAGGRMTETGLSLGTPHYMSPEQATAEKQITNRSDIYSLGSMLYEMLTGDPPHTGSSAQQIIMKIVTDEPRPVTELRKTVPPNIAAAVAMSLEKLPADRFESAAGFAAALADPAFRLATASGSAVVAAQASRRWKHVAVGATGLAVLAVVGALWGWLRPLPEPPRRPVQFEVPSDSAHPITFSQIAISPDGSLLVYQVATASGVSLYRRRLDELDGQPIAGTEGGFAPFFSPDGTQLGFSVPGTLRRVPVDGGAPLTIVEYDGQLMSAAWSETDEILFSTAYPGHVYRVSASGGTARAHDVLNPMAEEGYLGGLQFVPGSDALLFSRSLEADTVFALATRDARTPRAVVAAARAWYVPSGRLVYVTADGAIIAQPFDPAALELSEPTARLAEGLSPVLFRGMPVAVSPSGAVAYHLPTRQGYELVMVDRDGNERPLLLGHRFWVPRFSPDGTRIAFGDLVSPFTNEEDIWIHDLRGGTTSRLTFDGLGNNDPIWSPGGRRIAFSRNEPSRKDLYVVSADGGGASEPATLLAQDGIQWPTDWSPDGRYVVFGNTVSENDQDIWVVPVDGGEPRLFLGTPYSEGAARVSPDGRWLAYVSDESGQSEVYVQSFPDPGRKRLISDQGGTAPIWGPSGRELFYWNPEEELVAAELSISDDVVVRSRTVLFRFPGYVYVGNAQYDVSPDGQSFVIVRSLMESRLIVALNLIDE